MYVREQMLNGRDDKHKDGNRMYKISVTKGKLGGKGRAFVPTDLLVFSRTLA